MKLNHVGFNQVELEHEEITVLFSYSTPVAVFVPGKGALVTNKFHSMTTSKHINKAVERWGSTKTEVDPQIISQYLQ